MPPRPSHRLAGLACAALLASACSGEPSEPRAADASTPAPVATTSPTADRSTPPATAAAVLRFTAPRLGGGTVEGEDLAGRDVAFWFWAPW